MTRNIVVFFTNNGVPATGLSPTIRIRRLSDNDLVVDDEAMIEVGDGFYKYTFAQYVAGTEYVIRADGTDTLEDDERYMFASNDTLNAVETGNSVWTRVLDGSATAEDIIEGIMSAVGGVAVVNNNIVEFKARNGTTTKLTVTVGSMGNRTASVLE